MMAALPLIPDEPPSSTSLGSVVPIASIPSLWRTKAKIGGYVAADCSVRSKLNVVRPTKSTACFCHDAEVPLPCWAKEIETLPSASYVIVAV